MVFSLRKHIITNTDMCINNQIIDRVEHTMFLGVILDSHLTSLNIGTMTGKSRELADLMKTRRIDVMCLQETRWGGNKARELGDGCKLFYSGGKTARNGVGICVRNHQDKVLEQEVCRTSDRVMAVKIVLLDNVWTIICAYAPQVGCDEDTKNAFWNEQEAVIMKVNS